MTKSIKNNMLSIVFSSLMVIYTMGSSITSGDVVYFKNYAKEFDYQYLTFALSRYSTWSSRLLIESISAYFSVHYIQFFIMIFGISYLFMTSIIQLTGFDDKKYSQYKLIIPILAIFFFPINQLFDGAGVIATMTNYYVPMCLLAYGLLIFKKDSKYYLVKLLAFIFAMQQEQFALLGFIIILITVGYRICQKLTITDYVPFLIFSMLGILSAKLSPGNAIRTIKEIKERFPDFESVSFFRKLDIGFIRMSYDLLFNKLVTLFFILMLVSILIFSVFKRKINQSITMGAIIAMIVLPYLQIWTPISKVKIIYDSFPKGLNENILSITGQTVVSIFPDLVMVLMLSAIIVTIWTILATYRDKIIIFTLLIGGTASKMLLSLSPTVSISGIRTFVPMIFCGFLITIYFIKLSLDVMIESNQQARIEIKS